MIIEGRQSTKLQPDWNDEFSKMKGELKDDVCRRTLGKFLMYNVGLTVFWLTGFKLFPDQRLLLKGWLFKNYSLTIMARGAGKSWLFSHFCYLYCIFNPGRRIVMIAPTFRSSRKMVENIEKWAKTKRGLLLRQCIKQTRQGELATRKPDLYEINFKNGASIIALPLGDAEKLRGYRCSVLGIDEGLLVPQTTIDSVLKPFLIAVPENELTRRQTIREREDLKISVGAMKEEDRTKFASDIKMIVLSSASYAWQDLYALYKKYLDVIYKEDEKALSQLNEAERKRILESKDAQAEVIEGDDIASSYLVHQISYESIPLDRLEASAREEIEGGMLPESTVNREFKSIFINDSEGYFRAAKMAACTIPDGQSPCIEIHGEKEAEYILGIDQNTSDSEVADHFAMCVLKIVNKKMSDGEIRKIGMVVHQYAQVGVPLREHIEYLYYILTAFNIVYIGFDSTQGENLGFVNICNESEIFRDNKFSLQYLEADFGKQDHSEVIKQVQQSYNRHIKRIVQPQSFHSAFQRASNEHLQVCFDRRDIVFAGKAMANHDAMSALLENGSPEVARILRVHSGFSAIPGEAGPKDDFIGHQDSLIDLVKKECALIEMKPNNLGHVSWDIPGHMKRNTKSKNRVRKDSYSALLLANWCLYIYTNAMNLPPVDGDTGFVPVLLGGANQYGWIK